MKAYIKSVLSLSLWDIYQQRKKAMNFKSDSTNINEMVKDGYDRLHIGCGGNIVENWINTDIIKERPEVLLLDASGPFPIPDRSISYVYSEHVFEHLDPSGQLTYLQESFRVLISGGRIRIATPDLRKILSIQNAVKRDFEKSYTDWNFSRFVFSKWPSLNNVSYKTEYVINNYMRDWGHQMIHSKDSLSELIELCGFAKITFHEVGESDIEILRNLEKHDEMIGVEYNRFETMIIEATKL